MEITRDLTRKEAALQEDCSQFLEYWISELALFQSSDMNILHKSKTNNIPPQAPLPKKPSFIFQSLIYPAFDKPGPNEQEILCHFISACLIYFYRINGYQTVSTWVSYPALKEMALKSQDTLSCFIPLTVHFQPNTSFGDVVKSVEYKITTMMQRKTYNLKFLSKLLESHENNFRIRIELYNNPKLNNDINNEDIFFVIDSKKRKLFMHINENLNKHFTKNISKHIQNILSQGVNEASTPIQQLSFLTETEKQIILVKWNNTQQDFEFDETLISLFERQVSRFPNKIALRFKHKSMTYGELNQRSNQLARYLIDKGFKPKEFAAIFLERSLEMIVAIFAVLKTGGIYVPIDVNYPEERVKYIIEHSRCVVLLTKESHTKGVKQGNNLGSLQIISLDREAETINKCSEHQLLTNNHIDSRSFSYLIYTSGSTGTPKGVLITHRNVINYASWFAINFKLNKRSIVDFSSSIGFDLSVSCTLVPLVVGAQVAICSKQEKLDPLKYLKHLNENRVTHIECTPDYFNHLLAFPDEIKSLDKLKWIMLGGDAVVKKDLERWLALRPNDKLPNEYGPTECTVATTAHIVTKKNIHQYGDIIPIGKPAFNTQAYVVDAYHNLCPIGVPGELWIGGESVATGYLHHELTNHKFISNPFSESCASLLYKTGDLVRWLSDGSLEFMGRNDDQIKIRGFRIEIREIEDCLLRHQQIIQCKVLPHIKTDGEKFLIAYLILKKNSSLKISNLRDFLVKYLPDYMVPERFIILEQFPVNNSGKVDVKALSQVREQNHKQYITASKPVNKTIETLLNIWVKFFDTNHIKPNDDFFELGGHSLTALKIINEIQVVFSVRLPIQALFSYPTITKLSVIIQSMKKYRGNNPAIFDIGKDPQIICLQSGGKKIPLFLIPPVGGSIFLYKNLVKNLKKEFPIYGLQDPGIENPDIVFDSLEEMAYYYLRAIQSIQNKGPYLLAGSSFGATLAVEIANQLHSIGEQVPFIGLFDGWAMYSNKLNDRRFFHDFMRKKLEGIESEFAQALLNMQYSREKLLFHYKIPKLSEQLTLFKAQELWPIFRNIDKKLKANGWSEYTYQPVDLYPVPGDHESMFFEPQVKILANQLNLCLHHFL